MGLIPGLGRSPGEGNGNPLYYSRLGNPMDRRAWLVTIQGDARVRHDLATKPLLPGNIKWRFTVRALESECRGLHICLTLSCYGLGQVLYFSTPLISHQLMKDNNSTSLL